MNLGDDFITKKNGYSDFGLHQLTVAFLFSLWFGATKWCCVVDKKKEEKKPKQVLRDTAPQRGLWIIFCLNWVTISEDATRWRALRMFDVEIVPLFFPFPPFQDGMRFWAHWRGHQQAPVGGDTKSLSKARWLHEEWAVMSSGLGLIPAASLGFSSSADASRESLALSAAFFLSFLPTTLFL